MKRTSLCVAGCILGALILAACGGGGNEKPTAAPTTISEPTTVSSGAPTASSANAVKIPPACALLTTADVEKITGYGNGLADAEDMGENQTSCAITAEQGKIRVQLVAAPGMMPPLPNERTVALEGGGKGIVKDSGLGQGWMSVVVFPDYTVTMLLAGTASQIDGDKKIATITKADGSTMTFEQAYEALARAIAHNAASGAAMPSDVTNVGAKGDPCALLTLDDVKAVMTDFTITGPESAPSAFGGNSCRFRAHSDTLKVDAIVSVVYFTKQQFQSTSAMGGGNPTKSDVNGVAVYEMGPGLGIILNKGDTYVRFSIDLLQGDPSTMDQVNAGYKTWTKQLEEKMAGRIK